MNRNIRILLVEDSEADARLIMEVLKDEKVSVDVTVMRDGESAMQYLSENFEESGGQRPDLIVLDLNLPKKDGREVLTELKADPRLSAIPVLVLTTSQSDEDILKCYRLHASCYITKPMDLDQFTDIVRSLDQFWCTSVRYPSR